MNNLNHLIELKSSNIIKIEGADAEKFLQGQFTCDVREVSATQSRLGAHCDHKGRVQAIFRLFKYQSAYYLQIACQLIEHLLQCLKKYAVFSKVTLTDVSEHWQQLGVYGPTCISQLNKLISEKLPDANDAALCLNDLIIMRLPDNSSLRFLLVGSEFTLAPLKQLLLTDGQMTKVNEWQALDIAAGIPDLFLETIGLFTPQQINLTHINGVSFNKGCYTGQEIIARMHYLGKSKQHMYKIRFTSSQTVITPGAPIVSFIGERIEECGTLVQAVNLAPTQWLGLATLYNNAADAKTYVENRHQPIQEIQDLLYTR